MPIPEKYHAPLAIAVVLGVFLVVLITMGLLDYWAKRDLYKVDKENDGKLMPVSPSRLYPMGAVTFAIACSTCKFKKGSEKFSDHRCFLCKSEKQSGYELDNHIRITRSDDSAKIKKQ